ncbi:MAG: FecR domain-containing protein, partial [Oscillospiraceae bacterium]
MSLKATLSAMSLKVKIIVVCAVIAIAGGITAAVLINAGKADTYRVLKVFELTGSAVVSRQGTGDLDAYVGMNLESGDTLMVGDGSTLRISMDGDKYVLLDGGTVLELIAEGTPSDSRTSINLKQGTILNELTTSLSANSSYEVATPKATMAVRGTSFMVSVELDEDGSYLIRTNTFHGKVEVILLDSNGDPTGESTMVPVGKCILIKTEPNSETGNPAEVDGTSYFIYETEDGIFVKVPDGTDPVGDIIYDNISAIIKEYALRSNDDGSLVLEEYIVSKLRQYLSGGNLSVTTVSGREGESTVTTVPEAKDRGEAAAATVPKTDDSTKATTTTAPKTEDSTTAATTTTDKKTVTTTAPETKYNDTVTTTVPTTKDMEEATTSTVPTTKDSDETSATNDTTTPKKSKEIKFVPNPVSIPWTVTEPTTVSSTGSETTIIDAEIETFTVSFIKDGITVYTAEVDDGGTVVNIPTVPVKEGHTGKWLYNGAEFTADTVITGNTTVEAEYTAIEYTVTFKADGTTVTTLPVAYGQTVTALPTIPDKTGHTGKWIYNSAE